MTAAKTPMPDVGDETLNAWIDGELSGPDAAAVAAAVAADPQLAARAQRQRDLRERLRAAFAGVVDEPVPDRLSAALDDPAAATNLTPTLDTKPTPAASPAPAAGTPASSLATGRSAANAPRWAWGAIAASLLVGVFGGRLVLPPAAEVAGADAASRLPAAVASALDTQLASTQRADAPVRIGLSYRSKNDELCRSYTVPRTGAAGIACHDGGGWQPRLWTRDAGAPAAAPAADAMRTASTALPPAVLRTVDDEAAAPPLDAAQEREAMARGWRVGPAAAAPAASR